MMSGRLVDLSMESFLDQLFLILKAFAAYTAVCLQLSLFLTRRVQFWLHGHTRTCLEEEV